jgi:hypothetical protein
MTDKPQSEDDKLPEAEAEERFRRTLGNLVNTAPAPHKSKVVNGELELGSPQSDKGCEPKS